MSSQLLCDESTGCGAFLALHPSTTFGMASKLAECQEVCTLSKVLASFAGADKGSVRTENAKATSPRNVSQIQSADYEIATISSCKAADRSQNIRRWYASDAVLPLLEEELK